MKSVQVVDLQDFKVRMEKLDGDRFALMQEKMLKAMQLILETLDECNKEKS